MLVKQAILKFSEAEKPLGDRLLKIATETDRVEGYSEPHATLIARLAEQIGERMGVHGSDLTALKFAALAHDLGERAMKRNYLLRPDALTWEETLDLWRHPILGEQAAGELRLSRHAQLLIRWHHEWWNGLGYPDGLAGETIPLGARILRVVDTYCALISNRPHRAGADRAEAEQAIADQAGLEFDPLVVKFALAVLAEEKGQAVSQDQPESRPEARPEIWPEAWEIPPDATTHIVLTPEGFQAAVAPVDPAFFAPDTELAPASAEPDQPEQALDLQAVAPEEELQTTTTTAPEIEEDSPKS